MIRSLTLKTLKIPAKLFLGRGIVDKHFSFLIPLFQRAYAILQKEEIKEVMIPLNCKLKVYSKDIGVGFPLLLKGTYEEKFTELFLDNIQAGDNIIDIGANVGYYTILAAGKTGAKGKVIAFEPDKDSLRLLRENIKLNKYKNVTISDKAVSNNNEELSFHSEKFNKGESSLSAGNTSSYKVSGVNLDSFLSSAKIKMVNLIKMDIEGAEILALEGAKETLKRTNIKLFIEYNPSRIRHYGYNPKSLLKLLTRYGFKIQLIIDETRKQTLHYSEKTLKEVMTHATYCNLFCEK